MTANYLQALTDRLSKGLAQLPQEFCARHAAYLRTAQNADGGFSGREGGSDLYYTGFALRGLAVLDALTPDLARRAAEFLGQNLVREASIVDFFSLLYSCSLVQVAGGPDVLTNSSADWPNRVAAMLEGFRCQDGGYAKTSENVSSSTYHTFLVGLCYQLLGRALPEAEKVVQFIATRRREDGGYVEIAPMKRSGTNPTAAAVGVLQLVDSELNDDARDDVIEFLSDMPSLEGGLRANARIPLADLLSTFTGCWTLAQLNALAAIDTEGALAYVQSLEVAEGGFRGGLWDEQTDVEYTFYGLGALALLS